MNWEWHAFGIFQVPVIALFTKYDQFKRDVKIKFKDHPDTNIDVEVERGFEQLYLTSLSGPPPHLCLESEHFVTDEPIFC
jgi:hypothetical protein